MVYSKKMSGAATLPHPQDNSGGHEGASGGQDQGLMSRRQMTSQLPPFNLPSRTFSPASQQNGGQAQQVHQQQHHNGGGDHVKYESQVAGGMYGRPPSQGPDYGHPQQHHGQSMQQQAPTQNYMNYWPQPVNGTTGKAQHMGQPSHAPYHPNAGTAQSHLPSVPSAYGMQQQSSYSPYPQPRAHNPSGSISRLSPAGPRANSHGSESVGNPALPPPGHDGYGNPSGPSAGAGQHGSSIPYPMYVGNYGGANPSTSVGMHAPYGGPPSGYAPYSGYPAGPYGSMYAGAQAMSQQQHQQQPQGPIHSQQQPPGHSREPSQDANMYRPPYGNIPYGQIGSAGAAGGAYGQYAPMHGGLPPHAPQGHPQQQHLQSHMPQQQPQHQQQQQQQAPAPYGRSAPPGPGGQQATNGMSGIRAVQPANGHGTQAAATVVAQGSTQGNEGPMPSAAASTSVATPGPTSTAPAGERPFKCDQCPQSFQRSHDLKRHKRIHLAIKPYPCLTCDKSFSRKDALKRHILVKNCGQGAEPRPM